jgi:hypothetical protein
VWGVGFGAEGLGLSAPVYGVYYTNAAKQQHRKGKPPMLEQFVITVKSVVRPVTTIAEEIILEEAQRYEWASIWEAKRGLKNLAVALGCSRGRAEEIAAKHATGLV